MNVIEYQQFNSHGRKKMQSKKQKKQTAVLIIGGEIVLAALLLFAIIWLTENVQTGLLAAAMVLVFSILVHQFRKNARILLNQEKADKDRLQAALAQIERERAAMENIQAALGSGPWSMEFDERGEIIACIWTDVFRHMLGYEGEADFPNRLDSWSKLLHEEDKAYVMKEYWYTVRDYTGEKTYDVKYRLLTRNAGWR